MLPESDPPRFYLQRTSGKATAPAAVLTPVSFPVEGQANSSLVRELGWYRSRFLSPTLGLVYRPQRRGSVVL